MKKILLTLTAAAALSAACTDAARPVGNSNSTSTLDPTNRGSRPETMIAHSSENKPQAPTAPPNAAGGQKGKWTQSGDPIDTKELDAAVASAEKAAKSKPDAPAAKKSLSEAYTKRAVALTEARQYASALGDYRRALKLDPENEEAKMWIDQIVKIYASIGKEPPAEGEEPPPLPYKKS